MKNSTLCAAALAALTSACSFAPRKPFAPAAVRPDAAAVYFYRPSEMTGRLIKPALSADGKELGRLPNDSYGVAFLPPGEVRLRSQWPGIPGARRDDAATVRVEAGKSYYLRVRYQTGKPKHLAPGGLLQFEDRVGLEQVAEAEAAPQMAGMAEADLSGKAAAP